jgi:hypothetical protein
MWSYVRSKVNPRWLWHAIDYHTGTVLAYVFGRRQDTVFLELKKQHLQSTRRNILPVKLVDGSLLMCHKHLACALV